jgi:arsenite-transporting ATPase
MTPRQSLLDRELLFFGGKGGVGKTTLAAAFALVAAERGDRTLLVSTDPAHSTGDLFETELGSDPRAVRDNLWIMEIDPAREADRYIADVKERIAESTSPRLLDEVQRQIDIARVSPGAEEAALFDRFTRIIDARDGRYARIFFDTAPTGQTLRLLSLPELMTTWISGLIARRRKVNVIGRMWRTAAGAAAAREDRPDRVLAALEERKARFERARAVITNAGQTAFIFVVVPEHLPIAETEKAVRVLDQYGIPIGAVVVNQILPEAATGEFFARRRASERKHLERIERAFADYDVFRVPLLDCDVVGVSGLSELTGYLPIRSSH